MTYFSFVPFALGIGGVAALWCCNPPIWGRHYINPVRYYWTLLVFHVITLIGLLGFVYDTFIR